MSHLFSPQEEKRDSRAAQSEPAVTDTAFLGTPQEDKSGNPPRRTGPSWLIPPQEEKVDVAALRGEKSRLDRAIERMEERLNRHRIEQDPLASIDEVGANRAQRGAVLSGYSGVTGEDFGIAETQHIVRSP